MMMILQLINEAALRFIHIVLHITFLRPDDLNLSGLNLLLFDYRTQAALLDIQVQVFSSRGQDGLHFFGNAG